MAIAMALCLFVSFSCNNTSTDDEPDIKNEMQVDGEAYPLSGGLLIDWEEVNNNAADFDLALYTEGIEINEEGMPVNQGSMIYFDLNSFKSDGFEGGQFNFGEERGPGVITGSSLIIDNDGNPNNVPAAAYINNGELHVRENNSVYEVYFQLITTDGDRVEGTYVGMLERRTFD